MGKLRAFLSRLNAPLIREQEDRDLALELDSHIQMLTDDNIRAGISPEEARRQARLVLGGIESVKEDCRDRRRFPRIEEFLHDFRYSVRTLAHSPGFTAAAVAALALGIGANSAIFSVVNALLLRPLPYGQPDRLTLLHQTRPAVPFYGVSWLDYLDWRKQNRSFEDIAAFSLSPFNLTGSGDSERLWGRRVSASFFPVLRVSPKLGRSFLPSEDSPAGPPVAVIAESLWRRRFAADPNILNQTIMLNGSPYRVIGVLPANFQFPLVKPPAATDEVFVPLGQWNSPLMQNRSITVMFAVGRLRPGRKLSDAQTDLSRIVRLLAGEYPQSNGGNAAEVVPLKDAVLGNIRPALYLLLGAVAFVLLIACANVANLLLTRGTTRRHEIAMRTALGAGRIRIMRQLLTESLLLSFIGGGAGLALAALGTNLLYRNAPVEIPRLGTVGSFDSGGRVLIFTLAASIFSGLVFGLAPALQSAGFGIRRALGESGRGLIGGRHWLRDVLVAGEITMALVLLAGGALMIRSVRNLNQINPGFDAHNVLTFQVGLSPATTATPAAIRLAWPRLLDRVSRIPGIESAAVASNLPMEGDNTSLPVWAPGRPAPRSPQDVPPAMMYTPTPDYLRVMRIPLVRGRFFTEHDNAGSPPVVVIDEAMAGILFPGEDPLGKRVLLGGPDARISVPIVGVVGHVKHSGLDDDLTSASRAQLYSPFAQTPDSFLSMAAGSATIIVRTGSDPFSLINTLRGAVLSDDRDRTVWNFETMDQFVDATMIRRRFTMLLLSVFAAVALLLAAVGVYGVVSYTVSQRTREIGIRMALGAKRNHVLKLIVGRGAALAMAGTAGGLALALLVTRAMSSLLFGVAPTDPLALGTVAMVLMLVALAANCIPARRASRVDPVIALRYE